MIGLLVAQSLILRLIMDHALVFFSVLNRLRLLFHTFSHRLHDHRNQNRNYVANESCDESCDGGGDVCQDGRGDEDYGFGGDQDGIGLVLRSSSVVLDRREINEEEIQKSGCRLRLLLEGGCQVSEKSYQ